MATRFEQRQEELERLKQPNVGLVNPPQTRFEQRQRELEERPGTLVGTPPPTNDVVSISDEDMIGGQVDTTQVATQPTTTQQPKGFDYSSILAGLAPEQRLGAAAAIVGGLEAQSRAAADRASYEREAAKMREESELKRLLKLAKSPGFRELTEAGIIGGEAKLPAVTPTVDDQKSALQGLEPTQLTYLLGELGYDITPKAQPTPTPTPTTPLVGTEALETSPTGLIVNPTAAQYAALKPGDQYIYNGETLTKGEENLS